MSQSDQSAEARRATERAARTSYGKLVAVLASRTRDLAAAEDALADAFRIALQTWPAQGVPANPEAWLVTVARRGLGHVHRHGKVAEAARVTLELLAPLPQGDIADIDPLPIPDERLKLMFICAHPAIDAAVQAPLMLQTVLGLDAARIAACFLTSPATMGQRLVRAKSKIRETGMGFVVPEPGQLPARLDAVLAAIYAAYGTGWEDADGADPKRNGLADEAIWLARVVVGLLPDSAEAKGLLALMLYCEARRPARRSDSGQFVPLARQDTSRWSHVLIGEAEAMLFKAARGGNPGRFQIEAAIQSVHVQSLTSGRPNWPALLALYDHLAHLSPTLGILVARAAVVAEAGDIDRALSLLDDIETAAKTYQPFWAARGHALMAAGQTANARACLITAAGLAEDPAVRDYLLGRAGTSQDWPSQERS